ncbi:rhomboid family intramembrane serine protease [Solitalea canadensis]|uniref:Putative membrane protein n=1 Tax=Solitalea canadensis (strain ATCC 29591 / DSM 3403 / JCM 21819 / LMG 8368 / NBRC 15130 / NCIMB 12057 / USAM 9D) TaxID=929556 RepID=H8KMU9_SOLCM|nr:rhomboid family intramembrane serine protease [Solitalea canadensis]AFD09352.1 putative membrane protein [Solitalea canadensis DSM 3403]
MTEYRPSPFAMLPPVVKNILIINVLFFIAMRVNPILHDFIIRYGAAFYFDSPLFRIWQLITYAFLQYDFGHIFFNMFAVFMFGSVIENYLGSKRFFSYYMITAIGAMILQLSLSAYQVYQLTGTFIPYSQETDITNPVVMAKIQDIYSTPTIGASGAVFGLLLAFGLLFPESLLYVYFFFPIKAKYFVIIYGAIELWMGIANRPGDNVAHYAHLGGMLFGFILLKVWKIRKPGSYY